MAWCVCKWMGVLVGLPNPARPKKTTTHPPCERTMKRAHTEPALDALAEELKCPITGDLPVDPVLAEDRLVYERDAIAAWLRKADWSPLTREKIGPTLVPLLAHRNAAAALARALGDDDPRAEAWREHWRTEEAERVRYVAVWGHPHLAGVYERVDDGRYVAVDEEGDRTLGYEADGAWHLRGAEDHHLWGRGDSPDAVERWWNAEQAAAEGVVCLGRGALDAAAAKLPPRLALVADAGGWRDYEGLYERDAGAPAYAPRYRGPDLLAGGRVWRLGAAVQLAAPSLLALPTQWPTGLRCHVGDAAIVEALAPRHVALLPELGAQDVVLGGALGVYERCGVEDGRPVYRNTRKAIVRLWHSNGQWNLGHWSLSGRTMLCAPTTLVLADGMRWRWGGTWPRAGEEVPLRFVAERDLAAAIDRACPERIAFVGPVVPDALRGLFVKQPRAADDQLFPTYALARDARVVVARHDGAWECRRGRGTTHRIDACDVFGFAPHHAADAWYAVADRAYTMRCVDAAEELAAVPRRVVMLAERIVVFDRGDDDAFGYPTFVAEGGVERLRREHDRWCWRSERDGTRWSAACSPCLLDASPTDAEWPEEAARCLSEADFLARRRAAPARVALVVGDDAAPLVLERSELHGHCPV
jgi:hypothetical protein